MIWRTRRLSGANSLWLNTGARARANRAGRDGVAPLRCRIGFFAHAPRSNPGLHLAKASGCRATRCRCNGPAVTGWHVCRMHGASGGAPSGPANGRWHDGDRSRSARSLRREIADLVAEARMAA